MQGAVFIDVESLTGWLKTPSAEAELEALSAQAAVRRAYGNFANASVSARQALLNRLGFELVHVYHPVRGKDSADIQMIVDVMDVVARKPELGCYVLATGDSDFSPLFRRLRELGKQVVGLGPRSPLSEVVRTSCSRYVFIDAAAARVRPPRQRAAVELLRRAMDRLEQPARLSTVKCEMLLLDPEFSERRAGFRRFLDFVRSADDVVAIRRDPKGAWFTTLAGEAELPAAEPPTEERVEPTAEPLPDELADRRAGHLQLVFDAFARGDRAAIP